MKNGVSKKKENENQVVTVDRTPRKQKNQKKKENRKKKEHHKKKEEKEKVPTARHEPNVPPNDRVLHLINKIKTRPNP